MSTSAFGVEHGGISKALSPGHLASLTHVASGGGRGGGYPGKLFAQTRLAQRKYGSQQVITNTGKTGLGRTPQTKNLVQGKEHAVKLSGSRPGRQLP
jgi:hypothetical protein